MDTGAKYVFQTKKLEPWLYGTYPVQVKVPEWSTHPFTEAEIQTLTYVVPIKDVRQVVLEPSLARPPPPPPP
jgi:hypothetical protein